MGAAAAMTTTGQRLAYIDSLRGIAALGVMTVHSAHLSGHLTPYASFGQRGVQLFYIISAFTLFLSLNGKTCSTRQDLRHFYLRRFLRVAPLYYVAIAANCIYQKCLQGSPAHLGLPAADLAMGLAFLNGWSARTINSIAIGGWSVAVEATFYLFLPFIYASVKTLRNALWFFFLSSVTTYLLSSGAAAYFGHSLRHYFEFLWFPIQLPVFSLGIVLYFLQGEVTRFLGTSAVRATPGTMRSWSLLSLMASAGFVWSSWPTRDHTLFISSVGLFFLVVALWLHPWKIAVNPVTIYLGRISYSLYLTHFFVVIAIDTLLQGKAWKRLDCLLAFMAHPLPIWCAVFVGALIASTITYHTIEVPFIAWGHKLTGKCRPDDQGPRFRAS